MPRGRLGRREGSDRRAHLARPEPLELVVRREQPGVADSRDRAALPEQWDQRDFEAWKDCLVCLEIPVNKASLETGVSTQSTAWCLVVAAV